MCYLQIQSRRLLTIVIMALGLGASMSAGSQGRVPDTIGGGLRDLIEAH